MVEAWLPIVTASSVVVNHCGLASAGRDVHLVYRDGTNLQYRKSVDEGSTFTTAVTIGTTDEVPLSLPVAVDGNYVHVVYCRDVNSATLPPKIYYRRSVDGGTTWDAEVTLDDGTGVGNNRFIRVSLRAAAGHVHLFWASQNSSTFVPDVLSYRRSVDNGTTWVAETTLASSTGAGRPEAALSGSTIHLVWTDTREGSGSNGGETFYMRSLDRGVTWGTEVNLSVTTENNTARPTVAAYGSQVVVAWQYPAGTPGSEDIIWTYSSDAGVNWAANATLVTGTGSQEHASLMASCGVFALCWTDQNDTPDTSWVKLSRDGGATWNTAKKPYVPGSNTLSPVLDFSARFLLVLDRPVSTGLSLMRSPVFEADPAETLIDSFNRADDATPPPGSEWTNGVLTFVGGEGLVITSNQVTRAAAGGTRQGGHWNVGQYGNADVVAELSAWTNGLNEGFAVYARLAQVGSGTTDGYAIDFSHNGTTVEFNLLRYTNSAGTGLGFVTFNLAAGDKVAITCRRDLIIGWHRPTASGEWTQRAAALDSTYATGLLGMEFVTSQNTKITNLWATEVVSYPQVASYRAFPKPNLRTAA